MLWLACVIFFPTLPVQKNYRPCTFSGESIYHIVHSVEWQFLLKVRVVNYESVDEDWAEGRIVSATTSFLLHHLGTGNCTILILE